MSNKLRGMGRVYRHNYRDHQTGKWKHTKVWWIEFYHQKKQIRKSSGSTRRSAALKMLREHLETATAGKLIVGLGEKYRFADLEALIVRDYRRRKRRSLDRLEDALTHLKGFFGCYRAVEISDQLIEQYVDLRLDQEDAANATVSYEMAVLKRMFHLARKILAGFKPDFPILKINNIRKGYFEESEFLALLQHLDADLQPPIKFAYLTGWRIKSEVFSLQWPQVDFAAGEARLEPGTTKTDEGRTFPFSVLPELKELLCYQRERTDLLQKTTGRVIPWVFHRDGMQIKDFRGAWKKAIAAARIQKRIPHDFRRTAVRNLERAGVPRSVSMKLVGHKTESIYSRYAIVAKQDLVDGLKRLADYRADLEKEAENSKVVPIKNKG
jgi:integrase